MITRKRQRKGEYTGTLDKPRKVGCGTTINTHISVDTTYSFNTGSSYSIALSEGMSQQQADREVQPRHVGPPGVELEKGQRSTRLGSGRQGQPARRMRSASLRRDRSENKSQTLPLFHPDLNGDKGCTPLLINHLIFAINIT